MSLDKNLTEVGTVEMLKLPVKFYIGRKHSKTASLFNLLLSQSEKQKTLFQILVFHLHSAHPGKKGRVKRFITGIFSAIHHSNDSGFFTACFNNMQTLKFMPQLPVTFYTAANHN